MGNRPIALAMVFALLLFPLNAYGMRAVATIEGDVVRFYYRAEVKNAHLLEFRTPLSEAALSIVVGKAMNETMGPSKSVNVTITHTGATTIVEVEALLLGKVKRKFFLFSEIDCSWRKKDLKQVFYVAGPGVGRAINLSTDLFLQFHFFDIPLERWNRTIVAGRTVLYANVSGEAVREAFGVDVDPSMEIALPLGSDIVSASGDTIMVSSIPVWYMVLAVASVVAFSAGLALYLRRLRKRSRTPLVYKEPIAA